MKIASLRFLFSHFVVIIALVFCVWEPCRGATVIDPSGFTYTGVSASSAYNSSYSAANLFNFDVSSVTPGGTISDSAEWATQGSLDAYVTFQIGGVYSVGSLFFAERDGGGRPDIDQMGQASIWASQTSPFDPNNPPGTAPDAFVSLGDADGNPVWREYPLTNTVLGRYFLIRFVETNGSCCNPGGRELRLGGQLVSAIAPSIVQNPANHTIYPQGTARFSVVASGSTPLSYQWKKGTTLLTDGGRISGVNTANLRINAVTAADAGAYSCMVTNSAGQTNSAAGTLAILGSPVNAPVALVLSNQPLAYYRFQEVSGATVAADSFNSIDAAYGADSILGGAGPRPSSFPGFDSGNTALGTIALTPTSTVTVPPLNLNTNTLSVLAWIYPDGAQATYASLLIWRAANTCGLHYLNGSTLTYIWNNDRWYIDSGLVVPTNQWSLIGLVLTSTNATLYLGVNGVLRSSLDIHNQAPAAFDSTVEIGCDNLGDTSRVFNGLIDEVAIFSHPLAAADVQAIYAAGVGAVPAGISQEPVSHTNYVGGTAHFNIIATGSSLSYQWKKGATALVNGGKISGATTPALAIANLTGSDAGAYSCVVSNSLGAVASDAASLSVIPGPTNGYNGTLLAYKPVAYWQLDESSGAALAVDHSGSYNGSYGQSSTAGINGPQAPSFPGFGVTNTALGTMAFNADSAVGVPALNLNTNAVTILAWIYPSGSQNPYTTMFMSRAAGTIAGLNYFGDAATLGYQWNGGRWDWDSGLIVPSDEWNFIALVITPTNGTLYLASNGGLLASSTQIIDQAPEGFFGVSSIARDNAADSSRVFNGIIDNVAVFNYSLGSADVGAIYNAALGQSPPPATLQSSVTPSGLVLSWSGPWTLLQADNINGPWSAATGISAGVPIPMNAAKRFYRLQH